MIKSELITALAKKQSYLGLELRSRVCESENEYRIIR
jgi:hypothetical protein